MLPIPYGKMSKVVAKWKVAKSIRMLQTSKAKRAIKNNKTETPKQFPILELKNMFVSKNHDWIVIGRPFAIRIHLFCIAPCKFVFLNDINKTVIEFMASCLYVSHWNI